MSDGREASGTVKNNKSSTIELPILMAHLRGRLTNVCFSSEQLGINADFMATGGQ